ncbi:MAG: toll/interleukin-1 receptor domain-containing protein [Ktedonobacterales bacterium]
MANTTAASHSVFISYSRADSAFVDRMERSLTALGMTTWIDRQRLAGGADWSEELQTAIESCEALLAIVSPRALASDIVRREYQTALSLNKPVFSFVHKRVAALPPDLARLQWSDGTQPRGMYHLLYTLYTAGLLSERLPRSGQLSLPVVMALAMHHAALPGWRVSSVLPSRYLRTLISCVAWGALCLGIAIILALAGFGLSHTTTALTVLIAGLVSHWTGANSQPYLGQAIAALIEREASIVCAVMAFLLGLDAYMLWRLTTGKSLGEVLVVTPECAVQQTIHLRALLVPGGGDFSRIHHCYYSITQRLGRHRAWSGSYIIRARLRAPVETSKGLRRLVISRRYISPGPTAIQVMVSFMEFARRQPNEAPPALDTSFSFVQRGPRQRVAAPVAAPIPPAHGHP